MRDWDSVSGFLNRRKTKEMEGETLKDQKRCETRRNGARGKKRESKEGKNKYREEILKNDPLQRGGTQRKCDLAIEAVWFLRYKEGDVR